MAEPGSAPAPAAETYTPNFGDALWNCTTGEGGVSSTTSCYNTRIDASQIVSGIVINCAIGALCLIGFTLWRGRFRIYFNRMCLAEVPPALRPPRMQLGGHHQLWSWLVPVFTVPDGKLLESAGLDALISQRIIGFGCLMFLPLTILGIGVLLPVNYTSYQVPPNTDSSAPDSVNDQFLKMTMSAIPHGSPLLWIHFVFTYIFMGWVCFLLIQYYKEFISLRQAHDEKLVRSAQLERRTTLLSEQDQQGSAQQIVSQMRGRLSMASGSGADFCIGNGGGGQASANHMSMRFSLGPLSQYGSSQQGVLGSADSRGSAPAAPQLQPAGSGASSLNPASSLRLRTRFSGQPREELQSGGSGSVAAPRPSLQAHPVVPDKEGVAGGNASAGQSARTTTSDEEQALVARRSVNLEGIAEEDSAAAIAEAAAADMALAYEAAAAAVMPMEGQGSSGMQRRSSTVLDAGMLDAAISGRLSAGMGPSPGGPDWDELALPFTLMQMADAAQFYTVLIVDEAIEEFRYRHEDRPWIWKLPEKLAGTPRSSMHALDAIFTESKALARMNSNKQKEIVEHRERRMLVAQQTYQEVFGDDFDRIVPVYNPKPVDVLLTKWWNERGRLDRLRLQLRRLEEEQQQVELLWLEQQAEGQHDRLERQQQQQQLDELQRHVTELQQARRKQQKQQRQAPAEVQQQQQSEEQQPRVQVQRVGGDAPLATGSKGEAGSGQGSKGASWRCPRWCTCCDNQQLLRQQAGDVEAPAAVDGKAGPSSRQGSKGWCPQWCCGGGALSDGQRKKKVDGLACKMEKQAEQILASERKLADLQGQVEEAQVEVAEGLPAPCFFASFRSPHAAAYAARLNLNPMHERMMRALPAPAPNNVNYSAMLRSWMSRGTRPLVVFLFVLLMLLFPIGVFAGICGTIVSSVCGTTPGSTASTGSVADTWFCSADNSLASFLRSMISSVLPSILLSVWQALIMPIWYYTCAQAEGRHYSFTSLDLRCAHWFFLHDLLNVFIGGMLGGSVVWGLRAIINEPSQFFTILGQAVPASSNFFINYISFRGLAMAPFRLFWPHAIVLGSILKWLRIIPSPQTEHDKEAAAPPISCRYSRDLGVLQLTVFVVALGYAVVSPVILPFALAYFLLTWPVWRYQMLYVYHEHYSCGGAYWVYCAHRIVVCLGVMSSFTAAVMAVKGGYVAALILFFTSIIFLVWFDQYLSFRYDAVVDQLPAVGILAAPRARVDNLLYVPPPMRQRALGWNPEWGKAWFGYGAPRYGP